MPEPQPYGKYFLAILQQVNPDYKQLSTVKEIEKLISDSQMFPWWSVTAMTVNADGSYPYKPNNIDDDDMELIFDWLLEMLKDRQNNYNGADTGKGRSEDWRRKLIHWLSIRPEKGK